MAPPSADEPSAISAELQNARLALDIDKDQPTPAYLQLRERLVEAISSGALPPGSALPSERQLATDLGLSRMTVRRAFEELGEVGLVEQRQGSGTYVRGKPLEQVIDRVLGFTEEARNLGMEPGSRVLTTATSRADEHVTGALRLEPGAEVLRITRLRTANGEPLALQEAHLPTAHLSLDLELLARTGSLYSSIEQQFGIRPARARQTISARLPTANECRLLGIARDVPVLALERTTSDAADQPLEFVRSAYRGDIYRMALDLRAPDHRE